MCKVDYKCFGADMATFSSFGTCKGKENVGWIIFHIDDSYQFYFSVEKKIIIKTF